MQSIPVLILYMSSELACFGDLVQNFFITKLLNHLLGEFRLIHSLFCHDYVPPVESITLCGTCMLFVEPFGRWFPSEGN